VFESETVAGEPSDEDVEVAHQSETGHTGSARRRRFPARYRAHQYPQIAGFAVATGLIGSLVFGSSAWLLTVNLWLVYSIGTLGFYFIFGIAGRFAFCQPFFMALGAYSAIWVQPKVGFLLAVLFAIAVSGIVSLVIGLALIRGPAFALGIATFSITQIGIVVFSHWTSFSGIDGTSILRQAPTIFGFELSGAYRSFWVLLTALVIGLLLGAWVERSPLSRDAITMRELPLVAAVMGVPGQRAHTILFMLSAVYGAVGGALFSNWLGFANIESYGFDFAVLIFLIGIVGGRNSIWGAVIGSGLFVLLPHILEKAPQVQDLVYGVVLLVAIIIFPHGITGSPARIKALVSRLRTRPAAPR
jgi:branched-chain amino acid transport system permease protein